MTTTGTARWLRRAAILGICAALLAPVDAAVVLANAPAAAASAAPVSRAHPYSDPIWFPLRVPVVVGCIGGDGTNNGPARGSNPCAADHAGYFAMNLNIPRDVTANPPVYAAGSGIVTQAVSRNPACVSSGKGSGGNQVVIDHGGGVVSVYQHLRAVSVKVGALVTPRTRIGTAGSSGASCSHGAPRPSYLDFQIHDNGGAYLTATSVNITSLRGCVGRSTTSQIWPRNLARTVLSPRPSSQPSYWIKVAYLTRINTPSGWNCLPRTAPVTPAAFRSFTVRSSSTRATVRWTAVRGATKYLVQTQIYRPSTRSWDAPCTPYATRGCTVGYYAVNSGRATSYTVSGLLRGRTYRFRISAHNSVGWSTHSSWRT